MRKFVICLVMLLLVASPASACIGARQAAMGWAGVAISDDATASYWNPAAMVWAKDGVMYDNIYDRTAIAATYDRFGLCYVDDWDKTYSYFAVSHKLSESEAVGISVGTFDAKPTSLRSDYHGPTLSASYLAKSGHFRYGLLLHNGLSVRPGIAYITKLLTVSVEVYDLFSAFWTSHYRVGIEINPLSFLALRAGFNQYDNASYYGVGLISPYCSLDFVKTPYGDYYSLSLLI